MTLLQLVILVAVVYSGLRLEKLITGKPSQPFGEWLRDKLNR
jgi:hypothetical protein